MNNILKLALGLALATTLQACDNRLEITPKGKTTLSSLTDIELLLNQELAMGEAPSADLGLICNECYPQFGSVPEMLGSTNTLSYIYLTYKEDGDRATLASEDARYSELYKNINYSNVVIEKAAGTDGEDAQRDRIIAEAKILRAYMHYLLVNVYARQYDASTAETLGGVPYVTDTDVSTEKTKLTIAEVYEKILEDCSDEVISKLNRLNPDVCRVDQAVGYAVRAKVLFQMKRYAEAIVPAQEALKINSTVEDRSVIATTMSWNLDQKAADNYLYMKGGPVRVFPTMLSTTPETSLCFEDNDYVLLYDLSGGWNDMYGMMFVGIPGAKSYAGWGTMGNVTGLRTEQMYYIIAECMIRGGKISDGLAYVDRVRAKRVENYEPFATRAGLTEKSAMELLSRAKLIEFLGSYERFFDCKRWNSEDAYKQTITRDLGEYGTYSIAPDSKLWVMPFPAKAVLYNKSLTQNY